MKKSWREKLADDKGLPKVCEVTGKLTKRFNIQSRPLTPALSHPMGEGESLADGSGIQSAHVRSGNSQLGLSHWKSAPSYVLITRVKCP